MWPWHWESILGDMHTPMPVKQVAVTALMKLSARQGRHSSSAAQLEPPSLWCTTVTPLHSSYVPCNPTPLKSHPPDRVLTISH